MTKDEGLGLVVRPPSLPEPLSPREPQVLALLGRHLSNVEIAEELVIAPSTVKTHSLNIYGKLGVHGRKQAVAKARELGILPAGQRRRTPPAKSTAISTSVVDASSRITPYTPNDSRTYLWSLHSRGRREPTGGPSRQRSANNDLGFIGT